MAKTYIDDVRLIAVRNKIFSDLEHREQMNIFDVITLSSGDYLPTPNMINGEYPVYGGGGSTVKTHNHFNVADETFGIGRVGARCGCVFKIKPKSWVTDNALYASKIDPSFEIDFLLHYLNFKDINQYANTSAQPVISLKRISVITVPKVPLKLQTEILSTINNIANGITTIEDDQFDIKDTLTFIESTQTLDIEFTYQLDLVKKLRQELLQDAVRGKLVQQDENDEPASELLKKIKTEKAKDKKYKALPELKTEEIPFEIPDNWVWCRLGEICLKITDGFHNTPPKTSEGFPYIAATHVKSDKIDWEHCDYVTEQYHRELYLKAYPQKGELLVVNIGAGCGTPAIIDVDFEFSFKNTAILKFHQNLVSNKFLFYYFILSRNDIYANLTKGGLQPFLSLKILNDIIIPFPPINEQWRIVKKLDQLMRTCDELEASIKESKAQNEMLLQQVLREALRQPEEMAI